MAEAEPARSRATGATGAAAAAAAEAREVLAAKGVTAGYGGQPVIEDVSLSVRAGRITAVVGPNGAGKSTLLKALCGLLRVSSGEVRLLDEPITNQAPDRL